MNNNDIRKELESIKIVDNNTIDRLEVLCQNINFNDNTQNLINPLLKILENNSNFDFGMPGFIVHTLEKYYKKGLEEELIHSLYRKPTYYTIWMMNRILNSETDENIRKKYTNTLEELIHTVKDKDIKERIDHILIIQN